MWFWASRSPWTGSCCLRSGLASLDLIQVLVMADCPSAQDRFVASAALSEADGSTQVDLTLRLPAGRVADSVRLSAHLVRSNSDNPGEDRVAHLRGARIHSSEPQLLRLEGDAGRFPTEAVPFSELGLGNASWTILGRYEDLEDGFMGSVRLLINTEHPAGRAALDPTQSNRIGPVLRADTLRLLIAGAADLFRRDEVEDFDEGSVGAVLDTMCRMFMGQGLRPTVDLYKEDPVRFELVLSDRTNPFGEILT